MNTKNPKGEMETFKTVSIPHLRHTVHFMDMTKLEGVDKKGSGFTCVSDRDNTWVFVEDIEHTVKDVVKIPIVVHEIIHVLQIICEKCQMQLENEQEHFAYLAHYLLDELINHHA